MRVHQPPGRAFPIRASSTRRAFPTHEDIKVPTGSPRHPDDALVGTHGTPRGMGEEVLQLAGVASSEQLIRGDGYPQGGLPVIIESKRGKHERKSTQNTCLDNARSCRMTSPAAIASL